MSSILNPPTYAQRRILTDVVLASCLLVFAPRGLAQPQDGDRLFDSTEDEVSEGLQSELEHVNPLLEGWDSEAFQEAAKATLKGFLYSVIDGGKRSDFGDYVAETFRGVTELRPENLVKEFDDGSTQAYRMPSAPSFRHPLTDFGRLLNGLLGVYTEGSATHMQVKVIAIDPLSSGGYETEVLVQLDGAGASGRLQQNFTWLVAWARTENQRPLIDGIDLLAFTEVHTPGNVYSEVTGFLLGKLPFFESQILQGVDDYDKRYDTLGGSAFLGSQGVTVADINGDGLDDIYVCQEGGLPNRLLLHKRDGTLVDVSRKTGTNILDVTRSALVLDLDGDGDQDLALAIHSNILLMYNDGKLNFSETVLLRDSHPSDIFSMAAADPDGDGDLDIYACRHRSMGSLGASPVPFFDANNGAPNVYWQNDGKRSFSNRTEEVGLGQNNTKYSFAAVWEDFDADGDLDLFVANDFGRNNLYRNENGQFTDAGAEVGIAEAAASMGVACSDFDLDGDVDILVSNMFSAAGRRTVSQSEKFMQKQSADTQADFARTARGNTLFSNRGDGTFEDQTEHAGVEMGRWSWGSRFVDFNNDGYEDMYIPNGFVTNEGKSDL